MTEAEREAREVYDKWIMEDCAIKEVIKPRHEKNWRWISINGKYYEFQTRKMLRKITESIQRAEQRGYEHKYLQLMEGNLMKAGLLRAVELAKKYSEDNNCAEPCECCSSNAPDWKGTANIILKEAKK